MPTGQQIKNFSLAVVDDAFLEAAIEWIGDNMPIAEVFSQSDLDDFCKDWAYDNGYIKDK